LSLQNISNVVTKLTPNKPFSYFTKKYSITASDLWTTPRTIDNFVYRVANITVLKEGVLYRRGSYFTSNWKPAWVVLTGKFNGLFLFIKIIINNEKMYINSF